MKNVTCFILLTLFLSINTFGQSGNIGIGTLTPAAPLHVKKSSAGLLQLENSTALGIGGRTELNIKHGNYFTGALATVGTGPQTARLGLFTGAHTTAGFLIERMSIDNSGNVGINNLTPNTKLDVIGTSEFTTTNGDPAIKVTGPAIFTQTPGDPSAIEVNGRIKMSGSNPRAFVVTSTGAQTVVIDHPDCNNNPNAIILVTSRVHNSGSFPGAYYVGYDPVIDKWSIYPDGYMVWSVENQVSLKKCGDNCTNFIDVPDVGPATIFTGRQFNVLVIGN